MDRLLLGVGAAALLGLIPIAWMWILQEEAGNPAAVYGGGTSLSVLALGIGIGMLKLLGRRT